MRGAIGRGEKAARTEYSDREVNAQTIHSPETGALGEVRVPGPVPRMELEVPSRLPEPPPSCRGLHH